jgi:hypothetical protein
MTVKSPLRATYHRSPRIGNFASIEEVLFEAVLAGRAGNPEAFSLSFCASLAASPRKRSRCACPADNENLFW